MWLVHNYGDYIMSDTPDWLIEEVVLECSKQGFIELVDWFMERFMLTELYYKDFLIRKCFTAAVTARHLDVAKFIVKKLKRDPLWDINILFYACHTGNIDIVKWLVEYCHMSSSEMKQIEQLLTFS
jgi:hypothetical protein